MASTMLQFEKLLRGMARASLVSRLPPHAPSLKDRILKPFLFSVDTFVACSGGDDMAASYHCIAVKMFA